MDRSGPHRALAALAARQHGVVARPQLLALGFTAQMIRTRADRDVLLGVHRGVYAVGHDRLSIEGRWMAAVLACNEDALLSHRDTLALNDVWRVGSGAINVTATRDHRIPGVHCHRTRRLERLDPVTIKGIPTSSLERAVLDCAPQLSQARLVSLLEAIERRGRFDLVRFESTLGAANGHRGTGRLARALESFSGEPPAVASKLEVRTLELVRAADLPEPSVNVIVAGERVDLRWPRHGVVLEVDSWHYHRSRRAFETDRRRGNAVVLGGDLLLRVTDERIAHEPDAIIAELTEALRLGLTRKAGGA